MGTRADPVPSRAGGAGRMAGRWPADSDLYAESSDANTVISYIMAHV